MLDYLSLDKAQLQQKQRILQKSYADFKAKGLKLDMSRGKPGTDQTDLSGGIFDILNKDSDFRCKNGVDCRNYGLLEGIPEMREMFAQMLGVEPENVFVGGNSSLNMMFDAISCMMSQGIGGGEPWNRQGTIKFLCPVPGYDRHFGITEFFGIEMINVPMTDLGPDMNIVEELVASDEKIKGIWCVPKYSNPQGITYSDETVRRFAALKPAAKDFRIMWDNAYAVHDLNDTPDQLLNIMEECGKTGNEDLPILFCSTSKITFPGSGVAAMAASENNMAVFKRKYQYQTIGFDKLNQLKHVRFFGDYQGLLNHMQLHRGILEPKFQTVLSLLDEELLGRGVASWTKPNGGYFVSVNVLSGCASRVVSLCREAGVVLTNAGATYPYGKDPNDSNIRLAPTYPPVSELETAMQLFCICVKLAAVEKLLEKK